MSRVQVVEPGYRHRLTLAAPFGGLLWVPYGVFEMLKPWGVDKEYRDDKGYEVVTDAVLYRLYNLPGSFALLLTAVSLISICHLLAQRTGSSMRVSRVLGYIAVVLGCISLAGVIAGFDPVFTGPRLLGTMSLGAALVVAGIKARQAKMTSETGTDLIVLGLLGLILFPLWPLVYALEIIPAWLGATVIALFGLGWVLATYRLQSQPTDAPDQS